MSSTTAPAKGLLDLPIELRLMIYAFLPNRTVRTDYIKTVDGNTVSSFAVITSSAQTAILATCREIRKEAQGVMRLKTHQFTQSCALVPGSPIMIGPDPRIECDTTSLHLVCGENGLLKAIGEWSNAISEGRYGSLDASITAALRSELDIFLYGHGYTMQNGSKADGEKRLRNFIRQAGWMLHYQLLHGPQCAKSQWQGGSDLGQPVITLALAQERTSALYKGIMEIPKSMRKPRSTKDTHNFRIVVNSLAKTFTPGNVESFVRWAFTRANDLAFIAAHYFAWEIGIDKYDEKEGAMYKKFWMEGEWL